MKIKYPYSIGQRTMQKFTLKWNLINVAPYILSPYWYRCCILHDGSLKAAASGKTCLILRHLYLRTCLIEMFCHGDGNSYSTFSYFVYLHIIFWFQLKLSNLCASNFSPITSLHKLNQQIFKIYYHYICNHLVKQDWVLISEDDFN